MPFNREEMRCVDCGSDETRLELQVDRGGKLVRFRVDCDRHGGFSHYLPYSEINRAVARYLNKEKQQ